MLPLLTIAILSVVCSASKAPNLDLCPKVFALNTRAGTTVECAAPKMLRWGGDRTSAVYSAVNLVAVPRDSTRYYRTVKGQMGFFDVDFGRPVQLLSIDALQSNSLWSASAFQMKAAAEYATHMEHQRWTDAGRYTMQRTADWQHFNLSVSAPWRFYSFRFEALTSGHGAHIFYFLFNIRAIATGAPTLPPTPDWQRGLLPPSVAYTTARPSATSSAAVKATAAPLEGVSLRDRVALFCGKTAAVLLCCLLLLWCARRAMLTTLHRRLLSDEYVFSFVMGESRKLFPDDLDERMAKGLNETPFFTRALAYDHTAPAASAPQENLLDHDELQIHQPQHPSSNVHDSLAHEQKDGDVVSA